MKVRVIVAEDNPRMRESTRRILEQCGAVDVVGEAGDGEEAVTKTAELQPDVVLMDIAMPRLNGIEATHRIRAASPGTAVIALTAYDDEGYALAMLEAGAARFLPKTVRADDLVAQIIAVHSCKQALSPQVAPGIDGSAGLA